MERSQIINPVAAINVEAVAPDTDFVGELQPAPPAIAEEKQGSIDNGESGDIEEDEILAVLLFVFVVLGAVFATFHWRSLCGEADKKISRKDNPSHETEKSQNK
ncbi:hypothetical protein P3T76_001603 [Phytophthora citrophthora]|uniref:Uncharacterized protein n=1 Tax=Phytophthora citrophthora TaxID=4793 RepID=A0AAD9H0D7_9STRA|nr:hypothetical protein P3T76_001603 [Phytophthora citrophthora]